MVHKSKKNIYIQSTLPKSKSGELGKLRRLKCYSTYVKVGISSSYIPDDDLVVTRNKRNTYNSKPRSRSALADITIFNRNEANTNHSLPITSPTQDHDNLLFHNLNEIFLFPVYNFLL